MTHSSKPRSARAEGATPSPSMGAQERRYGGYTLAQLRDIPKTQEPRIVSQVATEAFPALLLAAEEGERLRKALDTIDERAKRLKAEGFVDTAEETRRCAFILRTALSVPPAEESPPYSPLAAMQGGQPQIGPIVPPDDEAIEWARKLDAAATRHDQARTADEREKASMAINCLILDDERMVQMARALLARLPAEEK